MTRLNIARILLYFTVMMLGLNLLSGNPLLLVSVCGVCMLGLFLNLIKILYDVLVMGKNLNESYTFLDESKLYQMEK